MNEIGAIMKGSVFRFQDQLYIQIKSIVTSVLVRLCSGVYATENEDAKGGLWTDACVRIPEAGRTS